MCYNEGILKISLMIAQIEGKIAGIKGNSVILMVGGIGYQIALSAYTLGKVAGQDQVLFHIHTHVREDILALYGFLSEEELLMFELLISISGIGPKVALSILSIGVAADLLSKGGTAPRPISSCLTPRRRICARIR